MPSKELLNRLMAALDSSPLFKEIGLDDQIEIKEKYKHSSDDEILDALKALDQAEEMSADVDKEEKEIQNEKVEMVQEVKSSMRTLKKVELQDAEVQDAQQTDKDAEKLINGLGKADTPKKKKLFGIF